MGTENNKTKKDYNRMIVGIYFVTGIIINIFALIACIKRLNFGYIPSKSIFGLTFEFSGIIVCTVFIGGCFYGIDNDIKINRRFSDMLFAVIINLFVDMIVWMIDGFTHPAFVCCNYLCNSLYYITNIIIIMSFVRYLCVILPVKNRYCRHYLRIMVLFIGLLTAALIINVKYQFIFSIDNGVYSRGPLAFVQIICICLFLVGIIPFMFKQQLDIIEKYVILSYVFVPLICTVLQMIFYGIPFSPAGVFLSTCILYVHGHIRRGVLYRQQQLKIQNQNTAIMLSQIQPHFLYNALTSVAMLCSSDPELAKKTTINFTKYLRNNIKSLTSDMPISFEEEYNHTRAYLEIEKVRFPDRLNVEYDIQTTDFLIPALTLQPLAENAVKHGICKKEDGGTVRISTRKTENEYIIEIIDDGLGFEWNDIDWNSDNHIGINNVNYRLQSQVNGILEITSKPGKGTTCRIILNKTI